MSTSPRASTVLIVDDESGIREIIRGDLESDGHQVLEAEDGLQALRVISTSDVDVIVSDLSMPNMGGLQLLERLRRERWINPFIIVTGFGSEKAALEALRLGAFDFLSKPFDSGVLRTLVSEGVEVSRSMKAMLDEAGEAARQTSSARALSMIGRMRALMGDKSKKGGES